MIGQNQGPGFRLRFSNTIRFRLLLTFLLIGILPVVVVASISAISQWQTGRAYAVEQLNMSASFKQAQIADWVARLHSELQAIALAVDVDSFARFIVTPASDTGVSTALVDDLEILLNRQAGRSGIFSAFFVINLEGRMVFSLGELDTRQLYQNQPFFQGGLVQRSVYLFGDDRVVVVQPLLDPQEQTFGVFGGLVNMDQLEDMMSAQAFLAENVENYMVNQDRIAFAGIGSPEQRIYVETPGSLEAIAGLNGMGTYQNYRGVTVIGVYRWLPELQAALLIEVPRADALRAVWVTLIANVVVGMAVLVVAVVVALTTTQRIARPISALVGTARRIALGERGLVAEIERMDEIGALGQAFNSMTAQLRDLVSELEVRVEERTRALAQRTAYLEATAEVGRTVSSILDLDQLRRQVAELIRDRFGLYYVGLFQIDGSGEWAVLQAGTGEYGRRMLARGHRIRVGEGMVGWCVANDQIRVASDVGQDGVRVSAVELPDTRSEAALPLRSQGRVVGALSVQSERVGVFDQDALVALQTMADQVAVAIYNARLFAQVQDALGAARRAYGEMSSRAWIDLLHGGGQVAFRSDDRGVMRLAQASAPEVEQALREGRTITQSIQDVSQGSQISRARGGATLAIPIRIGDEMIGVLNTFKPAEQGEWTEQQISWLEDVTEQLSYALEAARFYQQTQLREIRERQIREIGANMQARVSLDALMQTAVADLARALNVPSAFVQLSTQGRISEE
ncbi:MAG: GAF domain-containing protein [Anaerolineae bacterium]|nr:GAF domain-containing protein [Anaerolineae bacterium]